MLFHSYEFIFVFLPVTFIGFAFLHSKVGREPALVWLALASLVFYGQWSVELAGILLASLLFNFGVVRVLLSLRERRRASAITLATAIAANIGLLGYFKYANFFIENWNAVFGMDVGLAQIILPVGISFYTFIQIGFLVEVHTRQIDRVRFSHYILFGCFFPCVTAGPIILQKEMMPQFASAAGVRFNTARIGIALTVFGAGLFKKIILADSIAPYADAVFDGVSGGAVPSVSTAWMGSLAYTLQLYFDFSGYSDMALGVGYLFGFRLPINFNSPLKARSITDFWRRWHMTMTRFFTTYLFSPIAFSLTRRAVRKQSAPVPRFLVTMAFPVFVTFILAGLWHGAGWTFVVFGAIHGVALAVNHAWTRLQLPQFPYALGWAVTMLVVIVGLVVFRAENMSVAMTVLSSMVGLAEPTIATAGTALITETRTALIWIAALGVIALIAPNVQQVMRSHVFSTEQAPPETSWLKWKPSLGWAAVFAVVLLVAIASLEGETSFLYYQF